MKEIEVFIKKLLLKLLFILKRTPQCEEIPKIDRNSRILLIRLNRIGDALVITPFISILKNSFDCRIDILADRKNHFIFTNNPHLERIIVFRKGLLNFIKFIRDLNKSKYDAVIDLHDDVSATVTYLIAFSNAKYRIALEKETKFLYTNVIPRLAPARVHVVDRICHILSVFNLDERKIQRNIEYYPKEESIREAESFLNKNFTSGKFLMGINISAGSDARFWGEDRFKRLIEYLDNTRRIETLILTAPADLEHARRIADGRVPVFYSASFDVFSAIVSRLNLIFTPDTSIVHVSSSFLVPVFGLYVKFNTDDMIWYPYKSEYSAVITEEPNLDNISFNDIKDKLDKFLDLLLQNKSN